MFLDHGTIYKLLKSTTYLKIRFLVRKCVDYLMINICADNV